MSKILRLGRINPIKCSAYISKTTNKLINEVMQKSHGIILSRVHNIYELLISYVRYVFSRDIDDIHAYVFMSHYSNN